MKETPILLKGVMVLATKENRKTQTRRLRGLEKINENPDLCHEVVPSLLSNIGDLWDFRMKDKNGYPDNPIAIKCPYGKPGDRLWVRETWTEMLDPIQRISRVKGRMIPFYKAEEGYLDTVKWKPSIHMPKKYARLWLEITDIRVERIQDISIGDVYAEGALNYERGDGPWNDPYAIPTFQKLWNSINEKHGYGWSKNSWVWVIEFKKC